MSANDYYNNNNTSTSGSGHQQPSSETQHTSNQQHSSHSYPPQGQAAHLHSYDNHFQLQDHAGRRRSTAISIPAGAAGVSLNPHLAQGFLQHQVPNNTPANHSGTSSVQHGHPNTSHFCPVGPGQDSHSTTYGVNGPNSVNGPNDLNGHNTLNGPNGPDGSYGPEGPDGERGLGATLVGGASGHFLAHQLGHGHHRVLGSAAGAVAANLLEHQLKKSHHNGHHNQNQHAHDLGYSGRGGGGGLSGMFGGGHHNLQQQAQQHHYPETHAGSVEGGYEQLGHGHEYGDDHGQGGVNQGHHGHWKHGKWGH